MAEPTLHLRRAVPTAAAGHRMAYWSWGDAPGAAHVGAVRAWPDRARGATLTCWPSLCWRVRAVRLRVVCPDVVGRGQSDWLADPQGYQVPTYAADMLALLQPSLKPQTLDWVGTSMGGLIGMAVRPPTPGPLAAACGGWCSTMLGPAIEWRVFGAHRQLPGPHHGDLIPCKPPPMRCGPCLAGFGPHTRRSGWPCSCHMVKPRADGRPGVVPALRPGHCLAVPGGHPGGRGRKARPCCGRCTTASRRRPCCCGVHSPICYRCRPHSQMGQRGPKARLVEFAGVGHAPTLIADDQQQAVLDFLLA